MVLNIDIFFISLFILRIVSAGKISFSTGTIGSACGRKSCSMSLCNVYIFDLHGCTGSGRSAGFCNGDYFQHFNDLCGGGAAVSIDWRLKPLIAQFQNEVGDFSECIVEKHGEVWECNIN